MCFMQGNLSAVTISHSEAKVKYVALIFTCRNQIAGCALGCTNLHNLTLLELLLAAIFYKGPVSTEPA